MGIGYVGRNWAADSSTSYTFGHNNISWNMCNGDYILLRQFNITYSYIGSTGDKYADIFSRLYGNDQWATEDVYSTALIWKITCKQPNNDPNATPYLEISRADSIDHPFEYWASRHVIKSVLLQDVDSRINYYDWWWPDGPRSGYLGPTHEVNALPWLMFSLLGNGLFWHTPMPSMKAGAQSSQYISSLDIGSSWYFATTPSQAQADPIEFYNALFADLDNPDSSILNTISLLKKYEKLLYDACSDKTHNVCDVVEIGTHRTQPWQNTVWVGPVGKYGGASNYKYSSILSVIAGGSANYIHPGSVVENNISGWWMPSRVQNNSTTWLNNNDDRDNWIKPYRPTPMGPVGKRNGSAIIFHISDNDFDKWINSDDQSPRPNTYNSRPGAKSLTGDTCNLNQETLCPFVICDYQQNSQTALFESLDDRFGGVSSYIHGKSGNVMPGFTMARYRLTSGSSYGWQAIDEYADDSDWANYGTLGIRVCTYDSSYSQSIAISPINHSGDLIDCYIVPSLTSPWPALDIYGLKNQQSSKDPFKFTLRTSTNLFDADANLLEKIVNIYSTTNQ